MAAGDLQITTKWSQWLVINILTGSKIFQIPWTGNTIVYQLHNSLSMVLRAKFRLHFSLLSVQPLSVQRTLFTWLYWIMVLKTSVIKIDVEKVNDLHDINGTIIFDGLNFIYFDSEMPNLFKWNTFYWISPSFLLRL